MIALHTLPADLTGSQRPRLDKDTSSGPCCSHHSCSADLDGLIRAPRAQHCSHHSCSATLGRSHEGLPRLIKAVLLSQPLGPGQADDLPQVRLLLQDCPCSLPVLLLHCQLSNRLHRHGEAGNG